MPVYKANALVLRRMPLGETDKLLTLYTREYGKLRAVAKGARRTTSRLAGASEPLMFLRALLAEGMNLDILSQCELRESFPLVRADFGLFLRATYACELLDKVTEDRDPSPDLFDFLLSVLYVLQRAADPDAALHAYELKVMAEIGYEPQLSACVRCDRPLGTATDIMVAGFSAARGGVVCDECAAQTRDELLPLSPETAAWMERLAASDDARALARIELPAEVRDQMNRALRVHLRYRLEREMRSTEFLDAFRVGAMDDLLSAAPAPAPPTRP